MATSAKVEADDNASHATAGDATDSAKPDGASIRAQEEEEDEPEGDRLSEEVEQLLLDIKSGKVKTTAYTFDKYMRHLDDIRGG